MRVRSLAELADHPDRRCFVAAVERARSLRTHEDASLRDFFAAEAPLLVARAPGRLDVMGGIADYSGSLVLQLPLEVATTAVLQARQEPVVEIVSLRARRAARFTIGLDEVLRGDLRDPARLRARLAERAGDRWAAYVVGVLHACLLRESAAPRARLGGFRLLLTSDVPEGKGVSSSAALEVSSLAVIAARYDVDLRGEAIATASQWAENHVAGAPCGIMDQMTSACGRRDRLLRLRCQPDVVEGYVAIPAGYRFYGIDSGIRHAVTGSDYGTVRTAAFMGYRIIAEQVGLATVVEGERVRIDDPVWRGYLANIGPLEFETRFLPRLPETMSGAEFLARYGGTTDTVTRVEAGRSYPVRQATLHPVRENARVGYFAGLLEKLAVADSREASGDGPPTWATEMGLLMYQSHASYGECGLGSAGTDHLVELVREAGPARGLYGAKITGGGSGGTVAVFGTEEAEAVVREIARAYESETGRRAEVFARSGPGAEEMGVVTG